MKPFLERLKIIADTYFGGIVGLAKEIGMKPDSLRSYYTKDSIPGNKIRPLLEKVGINMKYLDYGEGNEFIKEKFPEPMANYKPTTLEHLSEAEFQFIMNIPIYDLPAHANIGSLVNFNDLPVSFRPLGLGLRGNINNYFGIKVLGDSMKDALIASGDIIIYDKTMQPTNNDKVVVMLNGTILLKKWEQTPEGVIHLKSCYNGIQPIIVNEIDDKLTIIGVVKKVLRDA